MTVNEASMYARVPVSYLFSPFDLTLPSFNELPEVLAQRCSTLLEYQGNMDE